MLNREVSRLRSAITSLRDEIAIISVQSHEARTKQKEKVIAEIVQAVKADMEQFIQDFIREESNDCFTERLREDITNEADALSLKLCDLASSHMRQVYCLDWLGQQPSISPQKRADNRLLYDEKARILIARTCRQNPAVNRAQLSVRAVGLYDATRRSEQANEATYQGIMVQPHRKLDAFLYKLSHASFGYHERLANFVYVSCMMRDALMDVSEKRRLLASFSNRDCWWWGWFKKSWDALLPLESDFSSLYCIKAIDSEEQKKQAMVIAHYSRQILFRRICLEVIQYVYDKRLDNTSKGKAILSTLPDAFVGVMRALFRNKESASFLGYALLEETYERIQQLLKRPYFLDVIDASHLFYNVRENLFGLCALITHYQYAYVEAFDQHTHLSHITEWVSHYTATVRMVFLESSVDFMHCPTDVKETLRAINRDVLKAQFDLLYTAMTIDLPNEQFCLILEDALLPLWLASQVIKSSHVTYDQERTLKEKAVACLESVVEGGANGLVMVASASLLIIPVIGQKAMLVANLAAQKMTKWGRETFHEAMFERPLRERLQAVGEVLGARGQAIITRVVDLLFHRYKTQIACIVDAEDRMQFIYIIQQHFIDFLTTQNVGTMSRLFLERTMLLWFSYHVPQSRTYLPSFSRGNTQGAYAEDILSKPGIKLFLEGAQGTNYALTLESRYRLKREGSNVGGWCTDQDLASFGTVAGFDWEVSQLVLQLQESEEKREEKNEQDGKEDKEEIKEEKTGFLCEKTWINPAVAEDFQWTSDSLRRVQAICETHQLERPTIKSALSALFFRRTRDISLEAIRETQTNKTAFHQMRQEDKRRAEQIDVQREEIAGLKEEKAYLKEKISKLEEKDVRQGEQIARLEEENARQEEEMSDLKKEFSTLQQYMMGRVPLHATSDDEKHKQAVSSEQSRTFAV